MDGGSSESVAAIAVWTSCAAASMSRSRENCSVMLVEPWLLVEFIESIPAMPENCRSSGVATAAAIVSGLAPGRLALTWIVGKSTFGRSATGSETYPIAPKRKRPAMTSVVMTGRRMKSPETFAETGLRPPSCFTRPRARRPPAGPAAARA